MEKRDEMDISLFLRYNNRLGPKEISLFVESLGEISLKQVLKIVVNAIYYIFLT